MFVARDVDIFILSAQVTSLVLSVLYYNYW